MKKSLFLLGLLTTTVCLTACGSKDYNMSFEEALEIANHSALQDILAENDNFEQNFTIAGNYNADWTKVDANISSSSKQSTNNNNSESSTSFWANITSSGETIKVNWALDLKTVDDTIYLNLSALELTWSEDLLFVAMMTEWVKNQWFSIPMTGLSDMPSTFSIFKDSKELNDKTKEIIINDGSVVYSWKFTQFNWYNAWKFSLDNEKLNALIKEYYGTIYSGLNEEMTEEIPELNIQNFEWYLVITWKDKVTTVIESMDIVEDDITVNTNWFAWEDFEIYLTEWDESLISIVANKNGWKYEISANFADSMSLIWTISPKLSKSSIDLKFDATLTVNSDWTNYVIPFNGSWKYNWISSFTTKAPENAQDLTEVLWAYFGGMMWWEDYDYDYDYDYNYDEDFDDAEYLEDDTVEIVPEEVTDAE